MTARKARKPNHRKRENDMISITITEALADIKTIGKRLATKREFVGQYLARQEGLKDPLMNEGGSSEAIRETRQSIADLEARIIRIRRAITAANAATNITLCSETRSIADWLTWRREIATAQHAFLCHIQNSVVSMRDRALKKGWSIVKNEVDAQISTDLIVNIDERELATEIESVNQMLGDLDGQLSLKNATTFVDLTG